MVFFKASLLTSAATIALFLESTLADHADHAFARKWIDYPTRSTPEFSTVEFFAMTLSSKDLVSCLSRPGEAHWARPRKREVRPDNVQNPLAPLSAKTANPLPHFRGQESVRDAMVRSSVELIRRAASRIEAGGRSRAEDLHQVRVTIKRLRASLRMVRPVIANAFFRQENNRLKKAADRLSLFRDKMVSRQTLERLVEALPGKRDRRTLGLVLSRLIAAAPEFGHFREQREAAMNEVARDLQEAANNFQNMLVAAEEWEAIGPGLQTVYRRARNLMSRALKRNTDEAYHLWRKQVKYLYYQLQMLQPIWPKRLGAMVKQLKKLEEKLGKDHDLSVLGNMLAKRPEQYGGGPTVKRVTACLDRQRHSLRQESEVLGRKLFTERPGKLVARLSKRWTAWR